MLSYSEYGSLCKDCGFTCVNCQNLFSEEDEEKFFCEGHGLVYFVRPLLDRIARLVNLLQNVLIVSLLRMACQECDHIVGCEVCAEKYCGDCKLVVACNICKQMTCED
jgi:hypothetical protein